MMDRARDRCLVERVPFPPPLPPPSSLSTESPSTSPGRRPSLEEREMEEIPNLYQPRESPERGPPVGPLPNHYPPLEFRGVWWSSLQRRQKASQPTVMYGMNIQSRGFLSFSSINNSIDVDVKAILVHPPNAMRIWSLLRVRRLP